MLDQPIDFAGLRRVVTENRDKAVKLAAALTDVIELIDRHEAGDRAPELFERMRSAAEKMGQVFGWSSLPPGLFGGPPNAG